ncbi:hypothetical protein [Chitinophaga ginsengisoli]|uniref:Uncharacterized protein n=1 Tax=Chitinophaga ginsengisoli TaxID=363837 RepID=A0A2P8G2M8_9BACT|nr:hypothetical protein [Chitinophaga ginsengisoli]PSL28221.1 hypothetical protein CLV42_108140 [Chitinophaga ginsengisoli]
MPHENRGAETIHNSSMAAPYNHGSMGISRPAPHPFQNTSIEKKNQTDEVFQMYNEYATEVKPFSLPSFNTNVQTEAQHIAPFQLKPGNKDLLPQQTSHVTQQESDQPAIQSGVTRPVVQRMVQEGLNWHTKVKVNSGSNKGRVALVLMPYTNPGNTKEKGYFVSFIDDLFQRSFLYHELDLFEKDEQLSGEKTQTTAPHWTDDLQRFSGDLALKVAMLLREKYGGSENEHYNNTSFNGIELAIQQKNVSEYASLDELLEATDRLTNWSGENGGALDDWFTKRFSIKELSYDQLRELTKDVAEVGAERWNQPMAMINEGLWTDSMKPCITIAMTATHNEKRYNALLHSLDPSAGGHTAVDAITMLFNTNSPPLVPFNKLQNMQFFVAGGNRSSAEKAERILSELAERRLPVSGSAIKIRTEEVTLTKALLITSEGKVFYSMYDDSVTHK